METVVGAAGAAVTGAGVAGAAVAGAVGAKNLVLSPGTIKHGWNNISHHLKAGRLFLINRPVLSWWLHIFYLWVSSYNPHVYEDERFPFRLIWAQCIERSSNLFIGWVEICYLFIRVTRFSQILNKYVRVLKFKNRVIDNVSNTIFSINICVFSA